MPTTTQSRYALRVADLSQSREVKVAVTPTASEREALQAELDLLDLRKVTLTGTLSPLGKRDWQLRATLGATVVQTCVATLDPVTTRIDTEVERAFLKAFEDTDEPETEMSDEDHVEALGSYIDPLAILAEALSLALPLYPRAGALDPIEIRVTEPGKQPMSDEEAKPFAGLAALKDQLTDPKDS